MFELFNKPYIKVLFFFVLLFIAYNFVVNGIWESFSRIGIDFEVYYHWQHYLGGGVEKYIGMYPPFFWIFMLPWQLLPYTISKNLWVGFNLLLVTFLVWGTLSWFRKMKLGNQPVLFWHLGFIFIGILYYYPLIVTLQTGQANIINLFLLALSLWCYLSKKKYLAGIILGLAISLKILAAILILYWLLKREYKLVGVVIATIIVLWLMTIPLFGFENQLTHFGSHSQFTRVFLANPLQLNNDSSYAFWFETGKVLFHNILLGKLLYLVMIVLIFGVWIISILRNRIQNDIILALEYAWTISIPPLVMYYVEMHHFLLSLLFYLIGIGIWFKIRSPIVRIGLVVSWILVNLGFQVGDVTNLAQSSYLYRYLSLFGVLIGWIAGLIILFPRKTKMN